MKKVSVVVPVYNVDTGFLEKCIESILAQTYGNFEILIVDDGSKEDVAWCCDKLADRDPRIRLFHRENAGASAARNLGLAKATGAYLTFVDCDDWIDERCLELAVLRMEEDELEVLLWGSFKCAGRSVTKYSPYDDEIRLFDSSRKKELMQKTMVGSQPFYRPPATVYGSGSCCSKLYRLDFIREKDLKYPEGVERAEDVNFNIRVFHHAGRIGYMNEHLYYYRQHAGSATYRYRPGGIEVFTKALECLDSFLTESCQDEDLRRAYYMRCMFFFLESMDMDYLNPGNHDSRSETLFRMQRAADREPYRSAIKRLKYSELTFFKRIPLFLLKHGMMGVLTVFYRVYRSLQK